MTLLYASQQDYDAMAGKPTGKPAWAGAASSQPLTIMVAKAVADDESNLGHGQDHERP